VSEALTGAVANEFIQRRLAHFSVEEPPTLPDRTADHHLAEHKLVNPVGVDGKPRIGFENGRQRSRRLHPDIEPVIVEGKHQAVYCPLRHGKRKYAGQSSSNRGGLGRIEQRVGQDPYSLFNDFSQGDQRVISDGLPGADVSTLTVVSIETVLPTLSVPVIV